ncbi:response regulator [Malaciobacter marinus]|jgi:CheY-like chemotaxis protein|uniref:Response regulator receiver domain-containing protein n=1 Tax=Malaciobacter marinus TaxID=505249 RepID=A0AB36ZT81_9BACT|nr:response regulator [Malaciobacter marinus]PPK60302.1 response regulator receiver domain-containing protein [Malaciobacter marinus]SKB24700.1 Response regulator receiver domain-containing protein [Malaciobacter marinus]
MALNEIKADLKKLDILIVEDGKDIINIMHRTFKMVVNNIDLASNGSEALLHYNKNKPDLILTDIRMPHMDGNEFIKKIRQIDSKIPIIVITAYEEDLKDEDRKLVNAIFSKPINFISLINKIDELI